MNISKQYGPWLAGVVAVTGISAYSAVAVAQTPGQAEAGALEEVIVTAQRREQSASDVGVSISVVNADALAANGIRRSEDIVNVMPNIEITSIFGPGTNPNYSVRGVTQNDFNDATESPIAAYVDDVYLVATGASSIPLFDMNRVEVLRGPQGTLFGRNSTGGAIQFISNEPGKELGGSAKVGFGSHSTMNFSGALNLPLSDAVQARVAVYHDQNDGYIRHRTGNQPDPGQAKTQAVRAQLAFQPNEDMSNVLKFSWANTTGRTSGIWHDTTASAPVTGDQYVTPGPDGAGQQPLYGFVADNGQYRGIKAARSMLFVNKFSWKINDQVDVTSVTGYNKYYRDLLEDCDGGQLQVCMTHYQNPSHQFSQEVRAFFDYGKQRYTVGAYLLDQTQTLNQVAGLFGFVGGVALKAEGEQTSKGTALFVNGEFDLNDQFTLIAGLRGARDQKHINHSAAIVVPLATNLPPNPFPNYVDTANIQIGGYAAGPFLFNDSTPGGLNRFSKTMGSGKLELDYKPAPGQLIYGSISLGAKAPGFNNGFISPGLPNVDYLYKAEKLTAYEVGIKSLLADNRVRLNVSAYYYDYKDYQVLNFAGVGSLINNAKAEAYGVEFDLVAKPTEHLLLSLNGSLSKSTLFDVRNANGVSADREMPINPKQTLAASIAYQTPAFGDKIAGAELSGRMRSYFYNNPGNDSAAKVPSYSIANARVYLADEAGKWEGSLSVKNLFDKRYVTSVFLLGAGIANERYGFYGRPRWVSVDLNYNF